MFKTRLVSQRAAIGSTELPELLSGRQKLRKKPGNRLHLCFLQMQTIKKMRIMRITYPVFLHRHKRTLADAHTEVSAVHIFVGLLGEVVLQTVNVCVSLKLERGWHLFTRGFMNGLHADKLRLSAEEGVLLIGSLEKEQLFWLLGLLKISIIIFVSILGFDWQLQLSAEVQRVGVVLLWGVVGQYFFVLRRRLDEIAEVELHEGVERLAGHPVLALVVGRGDGAMLLGHYNI